MSNWFVVLSVGQMLREWPTTETVELPHAQVQKYFKVPTTIQHKGGETRLLVTSTRGWGKKLKEAGFKRGKETFPFGTWRRKVP